MADSVYQNGDWRVMAAVEYRAKREKLVSYRDVQTRLANRASAKIATLTEEIRRLDDGAMAFGIVPDFDPKLPVQIDKAPPRPRSGRLFKDVVFDLLKSAYPNSVRASDIKKLAEQELDRTFHPKTTGMSLYRLAEDGMARRQGWDWYYVPNSPKEIELKERENRRNAQLAEIESVIRDAPLEDLMNITK